MSGAWIAEAPAPAPTCIVGAGKYAGSGPSPAPQITQTLFIKSIVSFRETCYEA